MTSGKAQDLQKHQWNNRLLLVFAEEATSSKFQEQLELFKKHEAGLEERKLLVYQIVPEKYQTGLKTSEKWTSGKLYSERKKTDAPFEVQLIGLDSSTKLTETDLLTIEKLFSTIDAMPMRRAEMKKEQY